MRTAAQLTTLSREASSVVTVFTEWHDGDHDALSQDELDEDIEEEIDENDDDDPGDDDEDDEEDESA